MKRLTVNIIILLSLLLLMSGGCGGGDGNTGSSLFYASEPFSFEVPEGSNTSLTVLGVNGIIEINGSAAVSTVFISGMMKVGSASSAEAKLHISDMDVEVSEAGGVMTVETVQPPSIMGLNYIVEYSITLPETMSIDASQANGEIVIQGMNSDITASQANGTIEVDAIMPSGGLFDLSTANGDITLIIPTDTSATLTCVSATGRVRVYNLTVLNPVEGDHSLSGILGGGDGEIDITNANGDITVQGI
jgi:hypothetical protein